ncbi:MAG: AMP-binding protein [Oscillospiraceae bacterium]|jgi:acetyl-CoA synthetase|nr:AMP-binding protein [Oscillospiraceae bacterium]
MGLLERFLPRTEFDSYEDFVKNYRLCVPERFNFGYDVVDAWAELEPDKKALVWCDDRGGEKTVTFAEMSRLSNQAANWFAAKGIGRGDPVLLILRRRWEYWVCAAALHKLGAVLVPGSTQLTQKDIEYRVEAAGIKMVLTVEGLQSFDIGRYPATLERVATNNEDTMLVYFSSGTTGMPKMVRHDFVHPLGQIVTAKYWQCVRENTLHMSVSDSGWAKFGWGKIYGQWLCGACIFAYDMDKFVPKNLLQKVQDYKLTTFCAPPTMYRFMLQEDIASYDLSSVERYCNAGEPLNPEVFERMLQITGKKLAEGFGQSESSVLVASFPWFEPRPGSMGKPSPLYDIDIVDESGVSCEAGEEGEIVVRGLQNPNGLFKEYLYDDEANARTFRNGCYYTGDVAWRDGDGYYWFVGRNDDVIKCSGYRIGPFEVESALIQHQAVLECAVTAAPDPVRGQVVKATVVLKKGFPPSDTLAKELQEHVKRVTAPYKYPRIVEFTEELPKTVSGKIKRAEIRKLST